MPTHPSAWYDEQYNNRARVADSAAILQHWADASAQARAQLGGSLDVPYGTDASERLDIFPADQPGAPVKDLNQPGAPVLGHNHPGAPVLVHIHGGYWRALDKRDQSFVAPPFVAAGALVVVPNYALCPAVSIEHIALQMVRALAWVHRHAAAYGGDPSRIVVSGHSAGGHLAAMLLTCDWKSVAPDLPADLVKAALSVSGVFDLEPLRHAPFLAPDLKLTAGSARRLSPALIPAPRGPLVALVGGDESPEFLRQNQLIAQAWGPHTVRACEAVPGKNHMNVLNELAESSSRVHRWGLHLLGLRPALEDD